METGSRMLKTWSVLRVKSGRGQEGIQHELNKWLRFPGSLAGVFQENFLFFRPWAIWIPPEALRETALSCSWHRLLVACPEMLFFYFSSPILAVLMRAAGRGWPNAGFLLFLLKLPLRAPQHWLFLSHVVSHSISNPSQIREDLFPFIQVGFGLSSLSISHQNSIHLHSASERAKLFKYFKALLP